MDGTRGGKSFLPTWCPVRYAPKEKLIELYKNRWADWCEDPPEWFDDDLKALIPIELLVGVDERHWGGEGEGEGEGENEEENRTRDAGESGGDV